MPYFVWVGRIDQNVRGHGARGYFLARRGKTLVRKWGAVIAIGGSGGNFHWKDTPRTKIDRYRSDAAARRAYWERKPIATRHHSQLPRGTRILRSSRD
jgi:hypothetical protein